MRIVLQRVHSSSVSVDQKVSATINDGLLLMVGIGKDDTEEIIMQAAEKIVNLRIFPDNTGRFQHSLLETRGSLLLIPNFTLYAEITKGRRPEFFGAMPPKQAAEMFLKLTDLFKKLGITRVEQGTFGAHMQITLVNDGPVTMMLTF